ncbi:cathepsin L-like protein [Candidatus Vecturithrix granuli]|uniref:Cathepsin L-like protein n=1 Tax=Vecturithrix granuli TaxID=1499967 RepID=A0A0S6WA06_VECG1|nr:cathepsin L-like protein [Candidatus Vecturithrix granuli]
MKSLSKQRIVHLTKQAVIVFLFFLFWTLGLSPSQGSAKSLEALQVDITRYNLQWIARETALSHLSSEEKQRRAGGLKTPPDRINPEQIWQKPERDRAIGGYPLSYNLWDSGMITPVRDQESCGSCWAFAAVANLESLLLQAGQGGQDLSEQVVLNCSAGTCSGWYLDYTFTFLQSSGTTLESTFPYQGSKQTCQPYTATANIAQWQWINPTGIASDYYDDLIKTFIYTYGKPVSTRMEVYDSFYSYTSGIYEHIAGEYNWGGHFVLIIGWGNQDGVNYWICKNSWGTYWGQSGLFYIKAQDSAIGTYAIGASVAVSSPSYLLWTK